MTVLELRGGLLVREDAVLLAIDLEARGHVLSVKDGALLVTNGGALTATDRAQITATKKHLMAIATYQAPEVI